MNITMYFRYKLISISMSMLSLLSFSLPLSPFACQFSKDYQHSCCWQLKRIWLGCLTHNDHLQHFVAGSLAAQLYSGNECLPGRREALPKASLLHVEPLVHYLTNLLPSMSIIAIEELVRMRYILWSLSLFLSNGWQHVFEDTAHCWKLKRENDDQRLFLGNQTSLYWPLHISSP